MIGELGYLHHSRVIYGRWGPLGTGSTGNGAQLISVGRQESQRQILSESMKQQSAIRNISNLPCYYSVAIVGVIRASRGELDNKSIAT